MDIGVDGRLVAEASVLATQLAELRRATLGTSPRVEGTDRP